MEKSIFDNEEEIQPPIQKLPRTGDVPPIVPPTAQQTDASKSTAELANMVLQMQQMMVSLTDAVQKATTSPSTNSLPLVLTSANGEGASSSHSQIMAPSSPVEAADPAAASLSEEKIPGP